MVLNTQQIILLCLLVSFVTSIATGITVVSLTQQTPEPVTQTINRVIERTVESVTQQQPVQEIKDFITQTPKPIKDVETVVVNQEDQTINAVAKNENSVARLYINNKALPFVTMGIVLNASGDIIVDRHTIDKRTVYAAVYGSRKFLVKYVPSSETADFVTLRIQIDNPNDFTPVSFADSNSLKVAQTVISLAGTQSTSIGVGEIVSLNRAKDNSLVSISTSVNPQNVLNGSVLLNLQGSVIGVKTFNTEDRTVFIPINNLRSQISLTP